MELFQNRKILDGFSEPDRCENPSPAPPATLKGDFWAPPPGLRQRRMGAWPPVPQPRKMTVAVSFESLRDFISTRMRMSHIYQPVMIRELLTRGGKASIRNIAAAFLARDASQLEYYEQITKDMPGKVLSKHGVVARDGKDYRLTIDPTSLSSDERKELIELCDGAIRVYLQK